MKIKRFDTARTKSFSAIICFTVAAASVQTASAALIALTNAGFEAGAATSSSIVLGVPTSWTGVAGGSKYTADGAALNGISGGQGGSDQYFLAANNTSAIRQNTVLLWADLSVGDTLTIGAWTTYRSDINPGSARAYFWLNDGDASGLNSGPINVVTAGLLGGDTAVAAGVWTERAWSYTINQTVLNTAINNNWGAVEVQLGMVGVSQIAFDNMTLNYAPVPEPSALAICGAGLGLALLRRKRSA